MERPQRTPSLVQDRRIAALESAARSLSIGSDYEIQKMITELDKTWGLGMAPDKSAHFALTLEMILLSWHRHYAPHGLSKEDAHRIVAEVVANLRFEGS
jgi:hypothetical protein